MVYDKRVEIKKESVCMSEFTDVYNEVSEMLEKNTLELIAKLQYIVDNVEDRFDLQDSDFNLKELSKNE